jgi:hypothetical protein
MSSGMQGALKSSRVGPFVRDSERFVIRLLIGGADLVQPLSQRLEQFPEPSPLRNRRRRPEAMLPRVPVALRRAG